MDALYRKMNDGSRNSSTYHKKDGTPVRARLNRLVNQAVISCIGVDMKQHVCLPDASKTKCGVTVKSKKLGSTDWQRVSCYECTY